MRRRRSRPIRLKCEEGLVSAKPKPIVVTKQRFRLIQAAVDRSSDYVDELEARASPRGCRDFATAIIWFIARIRIHRPTISNPLYWRCLSALRRGKSASAAYGHRGKTAAMDYVWGERQRLFRQWQQLLDDDDRVRFCGRLPWIGSLNRYELAKELGANTVAPDPRLRALGLAEGQSITAMCHRLADETGLRAATVQTLLTDACMLGLIEPTGIWCYGWRGGTERLALKARCLGLAPV